MSFEKRLYYFSNLNNILSLPPPPRATALVLFRNIAAGPERSASQPGQEEEIWLLVYLVVKYQEDMDMTGGHSYTRRTWLYQEYMDKNRRTQRY